jgi:hypothetical protein
MRTNLIVSGSLGMFWVEWRPDLDFEVCRGLHFLEFCTSLNDSLAVVLDCHPVFTTIVILVGWLAKTVVAGLLKNWVGGDEHNGEKWMAYSIP